MEDQKRHLMRLSNALTIMQQEDADMPSQVMQTFLAILMNPELNQRQLRERLGMTQASISRATRKLANGVEEMVVEGGKKGAPGLEWITKHPDPLDGRYLYFKLTPKGEQVRDRVLSALAPDLYPLKRS